MRNVSKNSRVVGVRKIVKKIKKTGKERTPKFTAFLIIMLCNTRNAIQFHLTYIFCAASLDSLVGPIIKRKIFAEEMLKF